MSDHDRDQPESPLPLVDEDGVDLTLIRWSLSPVERLRMLQGHMDLANKMLDSWRRPAR